jgi:probable phosphoglycerate mutase
LTGTEPRAGIWLVRHAESTWNVERRWQGQGDPPLSETGRAQAAALAEQLADAEIEGIVASDLRRAAETAQILAARLGVVMQLDARWREHDVGAWSGLTHAEIATRWPEDLARFRAGDLDVRLGGAETRRELIARSALALAAVRAAHPGRRIAIVTHRGVIRALDADADLANCGIWRL